MALMDSEESFRKGYKKAGKKTLVNAAETMGLGQDYNLKDLTRIEIIELIESDMGYATKNKGGMVKSRTGPQDFRKGGMVLKTMDNRKNKG